MGLELDTSVKALGFSRRTTNALYNGGIKNVDDLVNASDEKLRTIRGMGSVGLDEISAFCDRITAEEDISTGAKNEIAYTFGDYLESIQSSGRNRDILVDYYNAADSINNLSEKYDITRQRVDQIVKRGAKRLRDAYVYGTISEEVISTIDIYAAQKTEVNLVEVDDRLFTGAGIARLMADIAPSSYRIYKGNKINGEWLVCADDNMGELVDTIVDNLKLSTTPYKIEDLEAQYSISADILMSIKGVIEKDGYITHEKNKVVMGTDRRQNVAEYLEEVGRPATLKEIERETSLTANQVRGAMADKHLFMNVAKSTYDLIERDYKELSVIDLAVNILTAMDQAMKLDAVVKYIQQYKPISKSSFAFELVGTDRIYCHDDYILLGDWSLDKIVKMERGSYFISLEDAILKIFSEASQDEILDYEAVAERLEVFGDGVSRNPSSVKGTLVRLADKNKIVRVGGERSGCYAKSTKAIFPPVDTDEILDLGKFINANIGKQIEIRYKTDRVGSDKKWRKVLVEGQDARYLYTRDKNRFGYDIKYVKAKIVEYRESTSAQQTPASTPSNSSLAPKSLRDDMMAILAELNDTFSSAEVRNYSIWLSRRHPEANIDSKISELLKELQDDFVIEMLPSGDYRKLGVYTNASA